MNPSVKIWRLGILLLVFAGCKNAGEVGDNKGAITKQEGPNIVVIMSDDHAVNAVSAYGSILINTPNIDGLANEGMLFTNNFCTNSICGPSRSSILTGKYSHIHGTKTNYIRPNNNQITYPELLKKRGYQTALVGKTHYGENTDLIESLDYYMISHGAQYHSPYFIEKGKEKSAQKGYVTDVVTDKGLAWIDQLDKAKPFLLMLHHPAPHMPFQETEDLFLKYKNKRYPLPKSYNDSSKNKPNSPRPFNITMEGLMKFQERKLVWGEHAWEAPQGIKGKELRSWIYQRLMRAYLACIESLDQNVGKVLEYLKESHLNENTIVIYTSDQGFSLGEHGWYDKRFMYEESIHAPLIVKYPGITDNGGESQAMTLNIDLPSTILDMVGIEIPDDMQGLSFWPIIKGDSVKNWRNSMYYHYYESREDSPLPVSKHYGIRTDRYKLIRFYNEKNSQWELFDLEKDPYELENIYFLDSNKDIIGELKESLKKHRENFKDNTGPEVILKKNIN